MRAGFHLKIGADVVGFEEALRVCQGGHGDQALQLGLGLHVIKVDAESAGRAVDLTHLNTCGALGL